MSDYQDYPDRPDLVLCKRCSTRSLGRAIPRDEMQQHDEWHRKNLEEGS